MTRGEFPPIDGVEHRFAQAGGVRLHYVEAGAGEPVILLHGWPQHHWVWREVIPRVVAGGRRAIAPDLRGFGWSDAPRTTYRKGEQAGDVIALMDAIGIERATLAGHDWGGYVSFLAALRAPERFDRVEGFGITHPWTRRASPQAVVTAMLYQPLIATPYVGPLAQRFTPLLDLVMRFSGMPERDVYLRRLRDGDRAEAASRMYRSFLLHEARTAPDGRLEVPARITIGSNEPIASEGMVESAEDRFAAGLSVDVLDGAGHWLPEERPAEVAERILAAA